ncbi:AI-2E family transporter [Clostridium folliculivorans]|uniref:AI-2E family transporter n=2 Tax=Clostridium folliculivorans TaxID=2886038 RepID=A0A9W5Y021_9CLOT|nr:AI-2E family transporter [Clostridium folliculivorans]GKU24035.1 AI-2E family transporter [Clostridium folliculivorans]GKU30150.1 AI-2E family transporter [Clostridium folliculivorans]
MKLDKKLLQYSLYAVGTVMIIYIGISILNNIVNIYNLVSTGLRTAYGLVKPLLIALVIAYLLKPGVDAIEKFLEKRQIIKKPSARRTVGIVVVYALMIGLFLSIIIGIYIMVGGKLSNNTTIANMTSYLNEYLNNTKLSVNYISEKLQSLNISIPTDLNEKIAQVVSYVQTYVTASIGGLANFVVSMGGNIATFFIALILSIYLVKDSEYFSDIWNKIFNLLFGKSKAGHKLREIFAILDNTFNNYIRGQLLEASMVGILSAIVLYFIGIDYAFVIGIIAGICNMIPYVGPLVGTVLAVVMALLSGEPITALWAIVGMLAVQQVDNNFLAPKIVGDSVGLHPVFTMLAILIGGNVGGLIGMLIAVPVAASLKIIFSKWYNDHMEKSKV